MSMKTVASFLRKEAEYLESLRSKIQLLQCDESRQMNFLEAIEACDDERMDQFRRIVNRRNIAHEDKVCQLYELMGVMA